MMNLRSSWPLLVLLVFAVMFPSFGEKYYVDLVMKIMILSVFALSLELLVGQTGLVSFGHAAFFGIGAYVAALLSPQSGPASFWLLFPAALGAAGLYALAVGALSLRTRGIYFIMVTLAFAQMAYYVFHDTKVGGGSDGIYLYFRPEIAIGSLQLLDLGQPLVFYFFVFTALVLTFLLLAAARGTAITVEAVGIDEQAAVEALVQLVESGFGEEWSV